MAAPPDYSQQDQFASTSALVPRDRIQISIIPLPDALQFQKGHLGVDNEPAALEGEVQIKGAADDGWDSVTVMIRSEESCDGDSVELAARKITLYSQDSSSSATIPPSLPFSIPLTSDTPQCIHTSKAAISHSLTATLHSSRSNNPPLSKTIFVHTRRYSPRSSVLFTAPESFDASDPVPFHVQLARRVYHSGEIIPVYITVSPMSKEALRRNGLNLRNTVAEVHRQIQRLSSKSDQAVRIEHALVSNDNLTSSSHRTADKSHHRQLSDDSQSSAEGGVDIVVARSGALCRFHDTKPLKIRLLLRMPTAESSPGAASSSTSNDRALGGLDCGLISQTTLLHSVSYQLRVDVRFLTTNPTEEKITTIRVPLVVLPPLASAPEIDATFDEAYRKKHDRPPVKTSRHPQADIYGDRDESGPSAITAPPAFDEPGGAPPSFTASAAESTSAFQPPSFVESQRDLADIPGIEYSPNEEIMENYMPSTSFDGEGIMFGFRATEEFDGLQGSRRDELSTPDLLPVQRANHLDDDTPGIGSLTSSDTQLHTSHVRSGPALDDPMDPPPTIDVEYIAAPGSTEVIQGQQPPPPHSDEDPNPIQGPTPSSSRAVEQGAHAGTAPPPYPLPIRHRDPPPAPGPPPYAEGPGSS